ncbi:hypothetical protein D047_2667, partial [Vibrio parahaemolyticus VPTS-2010_2]
AQTSSQDLCPVQQYSQSPLPHPVLFCALS